MPPAGDQPRHLACVCFHRFIQCLWQTVFFYSCTFSFVPVRCFLPQMAWMNHSIPQGRPHLANSILVRAVTRRVRDRMLGCMGSFGFMVRDGSQDAMVRHFTGRRCRCHWVTGTGLASNGTEIGSCFHVRTAGSRNVTSGGVAQSIIQWSSRPHCIMRERHQHLCDIDWSIRG